MIQSHIQQILSVWIGKKYRSFSRQQTHCPSCLHFTENSSISVKCFNPGVTIVPSQPFTTDTPTASTTVSAVTNTFSFLSTTNIDTSTVTSHVTSNLKSSTVIPNSSTETLGTTRTEFSKTTAILTSDSTSSVDFFSSTVTYIKKAESTTGVDTGTTTLVKTSSTGKEDVKSNVKKVIYTADFNGTVILNLLITILPSLHE